MVKNRKINCSPKFLSTLILASALGAASLVLAEPQTGRLPDGRAYRTDAGGNQLVDYIAELELNNSTLRQQISGLENEVAQKQSQLDNTRANGCAINDRMKEVDLLNSKPQKTEVKSALVGGSPAASCPACPATVCAKTVCPSQAACDCSALISQAKQEGQESLRRAQAEIALDAQQRDRELQRTKAELKEAQIQVAQLQRVSAQSGNTSDQLKSAQTEIALLRAKLNDSQDLVSRAEQKALGDVDSLQAQVTQLREERDALRSSQIAFKEKIATLQEVASKQPVCEKAPVCEKQPACDKQAMPVHEEAEEISPPREIKASYNPGKFSGARDAALDSLRGKILTSLNQIQGLVSNRDRLYAEYSRTDHAVEFKPAQARSSTGRSLQSIRAASDDALTVRELSLLIRDVNEIRSKIEFDIGMMERMRRIKN